MFPSRSRQDPHQDQALRAHMDHFRDRRVSFFVAHQDVVTHDELGPRRQLHDSMIASDLWLAAA